MKLYSLNTPRFIDPRTPKSFEALVSKENSIVTDWGVFTFRDEPTACREGDVVFVSRVDGFYKACLKVEKERQDLEYLKKA